MAPKRAAKGGSPSPKKARKVQIGPKLKAVVKALKDEELCEVPGPAATREMLAEAVGHTLSSVVEERHAYQSSVAKMIGEVLTGCKASWQKKVEAATAGVAAAQAEKEAADGAVKAAKEALEAQKADISKKKEELKTAKEQKGEAKGGVATATKEFKEHDAAQAQKASDKAELDQVYSESFTAMKTQSDDSEVKIDGRMKKGHCSKIKAALKGLHAEPSLVQAVDTAITKTVAERGSFDVIAVDGVDEFLKKMIVEKQKELDGGEAAKADKEKAKVAAEALLEATTTKEKGCEDALKESEEEKVRKSGALNDARNALLDKEKALQDAGTKLEEEKEGLDEATESMEAFTFLVERTNPPPEPVAPAAGANID